jgi:cysteine desulfurase
MTDFMSFDGNFGNPASRSHSFGWKADEAVEEARNNLATLMGCDPREIIWTSGATESDNLAIKGAARFYKNKGNHLVTSKIEHKAVLDPFRQLEEEGFEVTYLEPNSSGDITVEQVAEAVTEKTILVSLMHMNNELGTITDIDSIGELTRSKGIIFHVDAAQSIGKIAINMSSNKIDLLSISAHKFYGPKGVGALFVRRKPRVRLEPLFHGGGHERGFRSGTLATHQIVGLGEAARIAHQQMDDDLRKLENLKRIFWEEVKDIEEIYVNGDSKNKFPGILNISFNFVEGESLIMALKSIAVSSGSACTSASLEPSYVLRALGRKDELAHSSIRFSFGRYTTEQDVKETALLVKSSVERLREISPLWEMYQDGVDLDKIEWA